MTISNYQIKLLQSYRDKSFVTSILCNQSQEHYSFVKSLVNILLILSSSVFTILNSLSETSTTDIKYAYVVSNATTATILSLIGNFKISEQEANFKTSAVELNKLTHRIGDILTIDIENTTIENIRAIILEYDNLNENIDHPFPNFIKNRVKRTYQGKKVLPNILNCEIRFVTDNNLNV